MKKAIIRAALVTGFLLLIPLTAMLFTNEVNWTPGDFIVAGAVIFTAGLAFALAIQKGRNISHRAAAVIAIVTGFLLIWVNLAVGLIGSGPNPANLMYGGVIIVGIIGSILANFKPLAMSHVMFAVALAQVLVPVVGLIVWKPEITAGEKNELIIFVAGLTAFFVALWVVAGLLFRRAALPGTKAPTA